MSEKITLRKDTGILLMILLGVAKRAIEQSGLPWQTVLIQEMINNREHRQEHHSNSVEASIALIADFYGIPDEPERVLFQQLHDAIGLYDRERDERPTEDEFPQSETMIETIVRVISDPFAMNKLTSRGLEQLRSALLDPSEAAKLKQDLDMALTCNGCGDKFNQREALTIYDPDPPDDAEEGSVGESSKIYCVRCMPPNSVKCRVPGCPRHVAFDRSRSFRDHICREHSEGRRDEMVPAALRDLVMAMPPMTATISEDTPFPATTRRPRR